MIQPPGQLSEEQSWFSREELAGRQALAGPAVRRDWTAARVALKRLAADCLGESPQGLSVEYEVGGRPVLFCNSRPAAVHISLAHASGWGAAALAQDPVGVDLELVRESNVRIRPYLGQGREYTRLEAAVDGSAREGLAETILLCLKEAALKCLGTGLRLPREQVTLLAAEAMKTDKGLLCFQAEATESGARLTGAVWAPGEAILSLAVQA